MGADRTAGGRGRQRAAPLSAEAAPAAASPRRAKGLIAAWVLWAVWALVSTVPYLLAPGRARPGTAFTGIFFYQDDVYQYLSFAEQARHGTFLFHNKFDPRPHRGLIVNVEWWAAGALAALCGGRLVLGFQVLRVLALAGVVFGARRILRQGGASGARLGLGLVLFATAGGLGWLRLKMGTPGWQVPDVLMGMYPWHQALTNPHFVWGTALLLWSVSWYLDDRAGRGPRWRWVLSGAVLGFSRPYDLLTFMALLGALTVADLATPARRAEGWRRATDVLWLTPAALYYGALVSGRFGLGGWTGAQSGDLNPPGLEFLWAVLPAALAAALFWFLTPRAAESLPLRLVAAWALVLLAIVLFYPSPMAKQHATSLGTATLLAAALLVPARGLALLCLLCWPTSLLLLWQLLRPVPDWYLPADYFTATRLLAAECRPRDVVVAPTDLSLMAAGLTPCSVALGHRALTPGWPAAIGEGRRFYDAATSVEWRRSYLDGLRARFVALPRGRGAWLGTDGAFRQRLSTPVMELWERAPAGG